MPIAIGMNVFVIPSVLICVLTGIDDGDDVDPDLLAGIYDRIKQQEFRAGVDQVTQVMKVEQTIVGKKPVSENVLTIHRLGSMAKNENSEY